MNSDRIELNLIESGNGSEMNETDPYPYPDPVLEIFPLLRQPPSLLIIYCLGYSIVFLLGLFGNAFVVISVWLYPSLRNVTNYLITSLAMADLLILTLCLPSTLLNNLITGNSMLKNYLQYIWLWVSKPQERVQFIQLRVSIIQQRVPVAQRRVPITQQRVPITQKRVPVAQAMVQ